MVYYSREVKTKIPVITPYITEAKVIATSFPIAFLLPGPVPTQQCISECLEIASGRLEGNEKYLYEFASSHAYTVSGEN